MLESSLTLLVIVGGITCSLSALMVIAGSIVYNVHSSRRKKQQLKHPNSRLYRQRPLITVFITTKNSEQHIEAYLKSLLTSSYRKLELIVIDSGSTDGTKAMIRETMKRYPSRKIRLIARRSSSLRFSDLTSAYKKYGQGQILTMFSADAYLDKYALVNAINHLNSEPKVDLIVPNQQVAGISTTAGLLQKYSDILYSRLKQFRSVSGTLASCNTLGAIGRTPSLLRLFKEYKEDGPDPDTFLKKLRTCTDLHCRYADDVMVKYDRQSLIPRAVRREYRLLHTRQVSTDKSRLLDRLEVYKKLSLFYTWFFNFILSVSAVLSPVVIVYFAYLAIRLHEPALLLASMIAFSAFLMSAIWDDTNMSWRQKLIYILFLPVTYLWFFLESLKLPLAILWSVFEN